MGQAVDEDLINDLYGAGVHDGDWTGGLQRCSELLGSADVCVAALDGERLITCETTRRFLSAEVSLRYQQYYARLDPKLNLIGSAGERRVFNDARVFDEAFVRRDPFYQEFSRWVGTRHTLDMTIGAVRGQPLYFCTMRTADQGAFDRDDEAQFVQVAEHFAKAHGLRVRLERAGIAAGYLESALDQLSLGVMVLDEGGACIVANRKARVVMAEGEALVWRRRLTARSPSEDRALQHALSAALAGHKQPSAVRATADERIITLCVVALPPSNPLAPRGAPAVLILMSDSAGEERLTTDDLAQLYGLTAAEAELAVAVGRCESLKSVAARRGVRLSTVRTHLLAVLDKTGVHRQADLVRLLNSLPGSMLAADQA